MIVKVKLFAVAKQAAGRDSIELELPPEAVIADVRRALVAAVPGLASAAKHLMFAVGTDYAADTKIVGPTDEVACIPPVSGG